MLDFAARLIAGCCKGLFSGVLLVGVIVARTNESAKIKINSDSLVSSFACLI